MQGEFMITLPLTQPVTLWMLLSASFLQLEELFYH